MGSGSSIGVTDKNVVIIGAGYGGIGVARCCDEAFNVTLIDRRDAFLHKLGSLRAVTNEAYSELYTVPYTNFLKRGKFVQADDTVVDVEKQEVQVDGVGGVAWTVRAPCILWGAYRALCARCAKSWPFSTTGSSVSSED